MVEHRPLPGFDWANVDWALRYSLFPDEVDVYRERGVLVLTLEPGLGDAVSRALPRSGASARFCTGRHDFDQLNREVGVTRVSAHHVRIYMPDGPFDVPHLFSVSFDPDLDLAAVERRYESLAEVRYARFMDHERRRPRIDLPPPVESAQCVGPREGLSAVRQRLSAYREAAARLDSAVEHLARGDDLAVAYVSADLQSAVVRWAG